MPRMRVDWVGNRHILKKDVYLTFCLWRIGTSRLLNRSRDGATVDVCGICFIFLVYLVKQTSVQYVLIHIGVGFCDARSATMSNAKVSMRGTSNRYRFPRFFFLCGYAYI